MNRWYSNWYEAPIVWLTEPLVESRYIQNYYSLVLLLFLVIGLCGLLAAVAYLHSLSPAQDSEKRSEYECGFSPFDSATRLPFDVHFYLVGILFLIFDVEISLLFPWVMGLGVGTWFSFYLVIGFILVLAAGFFYEWHRGALIWPSRQVALSYTPTRGLLLALPASTVNSLIEGVKLPTYLECAVILSPELALGVGCIGLLLYNQWIHNRRPTGEGRRLLMLPFEPTRPPGFYWLPEELALPVLLLAGGAIMEFGLILHSPEFTSAHGFIVASIATKWLKFGILGSSALILRYLGRTYLEQYPQFLPEFGPIYGLTVLMLLFVVGTANIIALFFAVVGASLGLYILLLTNRYWAIGREAGAKYFYLSTIGTGILLVGFVLLYLQTGTASMDEIRIVLRTMPRLHLLPVAVTFIIIGFSYKLAVFPGLQWTPEVYQGSPAVMTAFLIIPLKLAMVGAFIQLMIRALGPVAEYWVPLLGIIATISMLWGACAGVNEQNTKRLLAYSSIHSIGFILMGVVSNTVVGFAAAYLMLVLYAIMGLLLILPIGLARSRINGVLIPMADVYINQLSRLHDSKIYQLALVVGLFSMAGIPILAGFFGKYGLLAATVLSEQWYLVIVGLATSLIAAYYYLRLIKILCFDKRRFKIYYPGEYSMGIMLAILAVFLLGFILFLPNVEGLLIDVITSILYPA